MSNAHHLSCLLQWSSALVGAPTDWPAKYRRPQGTPDIIDIVNELYTLCHTYNMPGGQSNSLLSFHWQWTLRKIGRATLGWWVAQNRLEVLRWPSIWMDISNTFPICYCAYVKKGGRSNDLFPSVNLCITFFMHIHRFSICYISSSIHRKKGSPSDALHC